MIYFLCNTNEGTINSNFKKGRLKGTEDFMKCALTFLFLMAEIERVLHYTKGDPKNGKSIRLH